ncbi:MAG: hypothetical protein ACXVGK_09355 [Mycobacteriaceae bacterium]
MDTNSAENDGFEQGRESGTADESPEERSDLLGKTAETTRHPRRKFAFAAGALVVGGAVLAASVVYAVHSFGTPAPLSAIADRDSAVAAARSVAATMVNVKGGDGDGTLKAWRSVITGDLADQYAKAEPQLKQRIDQSTTTVTSTISNAALSEFNHSAGTALALVFVDTTRTESARTPPSASGAPSPSPSAGPTPSPGAAPGASAPATPSGSAAAEPQKQRQALTMSLTRTDAGWKASDLKFADPTKVGQ